MSRHFIANFITDGYDYKEVQNNGFSLNEDSGDCIDAYTRVEYGIETDKPAQCRIGISALQDYDEMPEYFGGRNLYLTEHENIMFMPSPEAFKNQYNLTDEQIESICNQLNSKYQYDSERPDKECLIHHDTGRGPHFHLQSHPNTKLRKK